jgi:hypothetical protein
MPKSMQPGLGAVCGTEVALLLSSQFVSTMRTIKIRVRVLPVTSEFEKYDPILMRSNNSDRFQLMALVIFKVCILLRVYSHHIQIPPSTQQLFINIYSTICFDPNGPSSDAASLTHSITELQRPHSHLYTYG